MKMKKQLIQMISIIFLMMTILQCDNRKIRSNEKFHPNDPFKETMIPSQFFDVNSKKDSVLIGQNGTVLVIPKGCFKNQQGEIVTTNIKLELAEALSIEEMLLSNLTTTSNGKQLETDGMIYLNATSKGEQLIIDKNNPIYIEIPTTQRKSDMSVYKGIRDEFGNMNWIEPKELENFLVPIDINLLNFYPENFESEVEKGLPFRNHSTISKELIDSLYYSFSVSDRNESIYDFVDTEYTEAYYNKNKEVLNGKYVDKDTGEETEAYEQESDSSIVVDLDCGVDPAIIKVIKTEEFQNTLIATREFEKRLKAIFKTCSNEIIEIYINNLDMDLYKLDSMAMIKISELEKKEFYTPFEEGNYEIFQKFYKQKFTNVKGVDKYVLLLKAYYEQQLSSVKKDLEIVKEKALKELQKKNKIAQKTADKYQKLLFKREKHRMETYGFEWTDTGWINIDRGTILKEWENKTFEIIVENGDEFDNVYSYIVYRSIESLYRLNTTDNKVFYVGNEEQRKMIMPINNTAIAISIGYTDGKPFFALKEFQTQKDVEVQYELKHSTIDYIKKSIKPYSHYGKENRIDKDLEYLNFFAEEKNRQQLLIFESIFIERLKYRAFPCSMADTLTYKLLYEDSSILFE